MFGKKGGKMKTFLIGFGGAIFGHIVYDKFIKDTPATDKARDIMVSAKDKADDFFALFVRPEEESEEIEEKENVEDFDVDIDDRSTAIQQVRKDDTEE